MSASRSRTKATCTSLLDRHPARRDEHVDDDQRDGGLAAGAVHRHGGGERASPQDQLQGTTQNDIIKEFLARGTLRVSRPARRCG